MATWLKAFLSPLVTRVDNILNVQVFQNELTACLGPLFTDGLAAVLKAFVNQPHRLFAVF